MIEGEAERPPQQPVPDATAAWTGGEGGVAAVLVQTESRAPGIRRWFGRGR